MYSTKCNLQTPAFLLDLNKLERNIKNYHMMATTGSKMLWPMIKTHKSTEIARMQLKYGATGFLCGTLDECEIIFKNIVLGEKRDISIMYAYPVASGPNILRVINLAKAHSLYYQRIDSYEQAALLNQAAAEAGIHVNYTVIINSGLNRFGVMPYELKTLLGKTLTLKHLKLCGISTHPGHVYSEIDGNGIAKVAQQESDIIKKTVATLTSMRITPQLVSTGSTPTHPLVVNDTVINCLHPGNYVFMDNIQIALGCAKEDDCALTILATVISAPREGEFIIDAGAKCLGLDKGAHGNGVIKGHGRIKGMREGMSISALSEEVGKIIVAPTSCSGANLKIGDKLEIIPNHACAAANNTSYYIAMRDGVYDRTIHVDMRGNSVAPVFTGRF
ncbi:MAG: alanine racemase [Defluviitaleaceae bacterium]|nr:alanine racemase [Defluviitaleaceae bacterium]